jgi:hypothetical protein
MSLEVALERNTAALERLIKLLTEQATTELAHRVSDPTSAIESAEPPVVQNEITKEQCQEAAAKAVERLGNTPEAKKVVKDLIARHGKLIKDLDQLQRNAVFSELENL